MCAREQKKKEEKQQQQLTAKCDDPHLKCINIFSVNKTQARKVAQCDAKYIHIEWKKAKSGATTERRKSMSSDLSSKVTLKSNARLSTHVEWLFRLRSANEFYLNSNDIISINFSFSFSFPINFLLGFPSSLLVDRSSCQSIMARFPSYNK